MKRWALGGYSDKNLSKAGADNKAYIVVERGGGIEGVHSAVVRSVDYIVVVTEIASWITPSSDRVTLAIETGLWAECGIFVERLAAVIGIEQKSEVIVSDVAARSIVWLEGETGAVSKTGANIPASLLFERGGAGWCDNLSIHAGTSVCNVACCVSGGSSSERDWGTNGESSSAG